MPWLAVWAPSAGPAGTSAWSLIRLILGSGTATQTLIEHWDGASWRRVASRDARAAVFNELTSVTAAGPDNVWAVGWAYTIARFVPLIEHWNGRSWSRVRPGNARASSQLLAVSAASARDVWAVGIGDNAQGQETLAEHWDGATWQRQASPSPGYPGHARLNAVTTISPTRAWATGWFLNAGGGIQTLTERWNGSSWQETPSPNPGGRATANKFAAIGTSPGCLTWAAGNYLPPSGRPAFRALVARVR